MRDLDIDKIGKKMPYSAPEPRFFEDFTESLMAEVAREGVRGSAREKALCEPIFARYAARVRTRFISWVGAAAAVALVVGTLYFGSDRGYEQGALLSENIEASIDSYLGGLSDAELEELAMQSGYAEDLYYTLLNE